MTYLKGIFFLAVVALGAGALSGHAGYYSYGHGYHTPSYYSNYIPYVGYSPYYTYSYYPSYPSYNYGYQYQSYAPSYGYSTNAYHNTPGVNYYDGAYHYHNAGYYQGVWYPAGNYAWQGGQWVAQQGSSYSGAPPKDWKSDLVGMAKQRDENAAYIQALKAVGVEAPFPVPAGGPPPQGAMPAGPGVGYGTNMNLSSYGANGSTLYGYTYSAVRDLYGDNNLGTLYQQAARLTQNAQTLAGQATTDFSDLVGREGTSRARVAEILAKAQAAQMALQAANPQPRQQVEQRTFSFRVEQGADGVNRVVPLDPSQGPPSQGPPVMPPAPYGGPVGPGNGVTGGLGPQPNVQGGGEEAAFQRLAVAKCASCHSGPDKKGGFDIYLYPGMDARGKMKVWGRLLSSDPTKRMPQGSEPLSPAEVQLFMTH